MRRGAALSAAAFRAVCIMASASLLVLALFCRIRLVRTRAELSALQAALADAENERVILLSRTQSALSLEKLEDYALHVLGMQHPEPGQIIQIDYAG